MPAATEAPPAAPAPAPASPQTQLEAPPRNNDITPTLSTAPRKGSARERMVQETSKKWGIEEPKPAQAEVPKAAETPPKPANAPKSGDDPPATAETGDQPKDLTPEQKKQNPWKLYRQEKERAAKLEQQMAEAKASSLAETEKAQYLERIEKLEADKKKYEDEIRYVNYEKSPEFAEKYEKPYEAAWTKAMAELRGVNITDSDGQVRPMEPGDILELVNLDLAQARDVADAKWGKFAGDAMTYRKAIRDQFEARKTALEEARKTGADREKQFKERSEKWQKEVKTAIKTAWDGENQRALNDPNNGEFFNQVEGDDTWNQLLGKGFSMVDKAFSENAMDTRLTPEQRSEVVKRHAAVRNRAAAFGPMKHRIRQLQKEIADLKKANGQYRASEPPAAGGTATTGTPSQLTGRQKMYAAQEKYAR